MLIGLAGWTQLLTDNQASSARRAGRPAAANGLCLHEASFTARDKFIFIVGPKLNNPVRRHYSIPRAVSVSEHLFSLPERLPGSGGGG